MHFRFELICARANVSLVQGRCVRDKRQRHLPRRRRAFARRLARSRRAGHARAADAACRPDVRVCRRAARVPEAQRRPQSRPSARRHRDHQHLRPRDALAKQRLCRARRVQGAHEQEPRLVRPAHGPLHHFRQLHDVRKQPDDALPGGKTVHRRAHDRRAHLQKRNASTPS